MQSNVKLDRVSVFAGRLANHHLIIACFVVAQFLLPLSQIQAQLRANPTQNTVRVMSFNIRYGAANDGANHWDQRKPLVVKAIQSFRPDILGTQETLDFQAEFLKTLVL